ncbi:protein-methionine-sulfoxide reductase heme-binding subunit MsrQ [Candidatus Amarolinea aalborgensis]|uniref:protein-methionine-sulfoxide reductase heme-binding subunit MsrQ n=1 Tax=Candidatus Amarolinea aalborgensis TaxID=2249329 RepID=UPI003BF96748
MTRWLRWGVHIAALTPLAVILYLAWQGRLTANPIQDITLRTGQTALVLLVLSLSITPLYTAFTIKELLPLRRRLGLYAFFYAMLHFLIFIGLDYGFDPELLKEAIFEKRYALVGFAAFLILLPLAVTSTKGWMRRLGKRWKALHRWVYVAAVLVIVHYVWLVKSDIRTPLLYGAVVAILLILRAPAVARRVRQLRQARRGHLPRRPPTATAAPAPHQSGGE